MEGDWTELVRGEAGYPEPLLQLQGPLSTDRLWLRGCIPPGPRIAIVGTRRADATGRAVARILSGHAVDRGRAVVSGGAHGVDTEAHRACLERGGRTLVVAATPPGHVYPVGNAGLYDDAVERGGGILTETPPDRMVRPHMFLRRNRLVAALSEGVVVVQAGHRSGALSTASWARKLGIPVMAVPGSPLSRLSDGPNRLIERGQATILCRLEGLVEPEGRLDGEYLRVLQLVGADAVP
ncbi:MAG: DNA-protecting protein DprA, partial [Deltaproteobacteria bacterium]|nr:DNA-protecting protein DprA [Deltaproteobacteria bacterium]